MLEGRIARSPLTHRFFEVLSPEPEAHDGAVFVIPARQNVGYEEQINEYLKQFDWCIVMLIGDEERLFDKGKLSHENMKFWLMQPRLDDEADFYLGSGYTPETRKHLQMQVDFEDYLEKPLDWFFAGQVNHDRREQAVNILTRIKNRDDLVGMLETSEGFTQGLPVPTYYKYLNQAKAIPAPSGIQSPDSFRLYEALEAGAVPIADELSIQVRFPKYWNKVFNEEDVPFKVFDDYSNFESYINDVKRNYPTLNNKVFAWWQLYKRRMVITLSDHVNELVGSVHENTEANKITIIMVASPIKSHPDTKIIETSINSIRKLLPDCEILIGLDGVRPEQENYRERYEEFKKRLLWLCNFKYTNVFCVPFEEHTHQAMMTKKLLTMVRTPTIFFLEHDMVMTVEGDSEYTPYDWLNMVKVIEDGQANIIRFHFEAVFPDVHMHLMIGDREYIDGIPLIKTIQYSQRPHLASTAFYRDMIDRYFTDDSRTFIEDAVHGKPVEAYEDNGITGWNLWRIWIYCPDNNLKRCYTIDGREDDPKYEMRF
jgi:hypothetical protein